MPAIYVRQAWHDPWGSLLSHSFAVTNVQTLYGVSNEAYIKKHQSNIDIRPSR